MNPIKFVRVFYNTYNNLNVIAVLRENMNPAKWYVYSPERITRLNALNTNCKRTDIDKSHYVVEYRAKI